MRFLRKIFDKPSYTDNQLIAMSKILKNKELILHMENPNDRIFINEVKGIRKIKNMKMIELIGTNSALKKVNMLLPKRTFIKLCKSSTFKATAIDNIYLKCGDSENNE